MQTFLTRLPCNCHFPNQGSAELVPPHGTCVCVIMCVLAANISMLTTCQVLCPVFDLESQI